VTYAGRLKATSASISGNITANSGKIAGWTISGNKLQAKMKSSDTSSSSNIYLDGGPWDNDDNKYVIYMKASTDSTETDIGNKTSGKFYVNANGYMFAENAEIHGTIQSKAGEIGGWTIENGKLYSDSGKRGFSSTGIKA